MQKRQKERVQNNFLNEHPEYHLLYYQLLKEAKFWNNSGQYWLGKETYQRAKHLLNGEVEQSMKPIQSERLYYEKRNGFIGGNTFI
tara:strand:- start:1311 stop:1568 length:258 start_codon:yes stop_codon:yes gene_type:complete